MNKKGQQFVEKGLVFLGLWLISAIVWAFFLDGINVAIASCLTAIGVTSVINITISGKR
ncbi:hypothetical protein J4217_04040 [Candidatus Pacearchaeota archaeon]|nr:hypothetical protein [Candidatus Pacearchaeota archaeon]